jgi:hypothetical protein
MGMIIIINKNKKITYDIVRIRNTPSVEGEILRIWDRTDSGRLPRDNDIGDIPRV